MKIAVCIKQVPARDSILKLDPARNWVEDSDLNFEINEPDAYALEEGLQLKEKLGGEVIVVCAGPARSTQTIREALAKGADRAIHIEDDAIEAADSLTTARVLAAAIASEKPDLVLAGLQSDDLGSGQIGVILAELLGMPHATIIMKIEPEGAGIRVKRELEDGWFQHADMPLPAVLTIQSGSNKLRYATLMGIKKARTKEIRTVSREELGPGSASAGVQVLRVYAPQRTKQAQLFEGDAKDVAAKLVEKLKFEARVL